MVLKVRVGIDVGGTFTKAVLIDDDTYDVIGKATTLTTHDAPEGVAKGVIDVFNKALKEFNVDPKNVVFVAHSTTQATNALLEGDVVPVGILGMGQGADGFVARIQSKVGNIELASDRMLQTCHGFIDPSVESAEDITSVIQELVSKGARVIVASEAYSVDDPKNELIVREIAGKLGLLVTCGHEMSKLYGLKVRTRTAAINASILPKMMETSDMVERSIRKARIQAPLMIMRGDGGVMDIDEVRRRPILTMLSGPSASVAGALMYLKVSNGIFFEVGGTSTNIGVIRDGRPAIKCITLGAHRTYVNSLDVRVIGVAGGSMPRIRDRRIVDVGPRSAHIAGLPYTAFAKPGEIENPEIVFIQPKPNDPNDYIAIKTANGKNYAITNTCAANALGITKPGDYSYGYPEASRKALEAVSRYMGITVEEVALQILEVSSKKIIPVIKELMEEYELEKENVTLVGGGGGAVALIPFTAKTMNLDYKISENAEVISSIGVALAMVRDMVERTIVNPKPDDILRIRAEAKEQVIRAGAAPESVEVFIEIDPSKQIVRATALGTTEIRTQDLLRNELTLNERRSLFAKSIHVNDNDVELIASTNALDVFHAKTKTKSLGFIPTTKDLTAVMDREGVIRLQVTDGIVLRSTIKNVIQDLEMQINKFTTATYDFLEIPKQYILCGSHIIDFSGMMDKDQVRSLAAIELEGIDPEEPVVLISVRR